eukprot:scaffold216_cov375-Pavlova_lutheri.AAC.12
MRHLPNHAHEWKKRTSKTSNASYTLFEMKNRTSNSLAIVLREVPIWALEYVKNNWSSENTIETMSAIDTKDATFSTKACIAWKSIE